MNTQKFSSNQVFATPWALDALLTAGGEANLLLLLRRHFSGNWGEVCADDWGANDRALADGGRLLSAYTFGQAKVWVITEAADDDGVREVTTILLPEEY